MVEGQPSARSAGTVRLAGRDVPRLGYGAMRLPGPRVWGPPPDRHAAVAVVRRAVELGVRVIDTAWYYGPEAAHQILAEALRPYPDDLVLATKLGGARRDDGSWYADLTPTALRAGCERDLRLLGLDAVPVTHLRWDATSVPFEDALGTLLELQGEGKIQHLGLSNVSLEQLEVGRTQTEIVSVSNAYSFVDRSDDPVVDRCTELGIPYLPYFPLAVGEVGAQDALVRAAEQLGSTPAQVALAWLLGRSPLMLPIPGTRSAAHLEENVAAAALRLPAYVLTRESRPEPTPPATDTATRSG